MKMKYIWPSLLAVELIIAIQSSGLAEASIYDYRPRSTCSLSKQKGVTSASIKKDVAAMINQHRAFRREIYAGMPPDVTTSIYIMLTSAHRSTTDLSYIATRNKTGDWSISRVGRTLFELPNMPPEIEPETVSPVTSEQGIALDRLMADPCLYAVPPKADNNILPPVGQWQTSVAVVTPRRMYAGYSFGPLPGPGGKIVSAITGW